MHRHGFLRGFRESVYPPNQNIPQQFFPPPRITNGKTLSVLDPASEWNMLQSHLHELGPSTSSSSSLSSERDYIQLDPWEIRRRVPVESKLSEPKKMRVEGDLIENDDPVPEYKKATSKPVIPSKQLDLGVISRHKKLKEGISQQLVEMQICKRKLTSDGSKKILDDFVVFCQPESRKSYVTITKDGLDAAVNMKTATKEFCRILYIKMAPMEELKKSVASEYRSFKGIRAISETEKAFCPYHPEVDYNDSYELYFGEPADGQRICQEDHAARLFPASMDGLTGENSLQVQLRLKWNCEPLVGRAILKVNKEYEDKMERVLGSIVMRMVMRREDEEGNVQIECSFIINRDFNGFQNVRTQEDYKYIFEKILEINEIPAEVELIQGDSLSLTRDIIRFKINQRICRCAVNSRNWDFDTEPFNDADWKHFLNRHIRELKWTVDIEKVDGNDGTQTAIVKFTDKEFGEKMIQYMSQNLNSEFFRFNQRQREGVAFYTRYVEKIYVPRIFRWMCNEQISALDDEMRQDSNMLDSWSRLHDLADDLMTVEGSSLEVVAHYKEKLETILMGEILNCSSQTNAQLLYGCGLQWVNCQQRKYASQILISVDRAHERIFFFGSRETVDAVREQLLMFVLDPHNFVVSCEIAIGTPKFLPVMTCVLDSNGEKVLSGLLGGCEIGFAKPNKLTFKGTVHQYNNLKLMLDITQYNVMAKFSEGALGSVAKEHFVAFSECAVCLNPHSYDKFRLACGHSYCLQCLTRMIQIGLKSQELPLRCAFKKCQKLISLNNIMSLLFDENSFKYKEFFVDRLAPFNKAATTVGAKKGDLPCCIKPGCEGFCPTEEVATDGPIALTCPLCRTARCSHCPNPPHDSRSCQQEADLRANDQLSIEHYIKDRRDNVKKCPTSNCQALIQKEQGCNHMQCTFCKMHFCWLCLFSAPTQNLVYAHMQNAHGTSGGEWAHLDLDDAVEEVHGRIQRIERIMANMNMVPHPDFFGIERTDNFLPIFDSDDEW